MMNSNRASFEEKLADKLVNHMTKKYKLTDIEILKAKYGLSILLINVLKVGLVYAVSLMFGVFLESIYLHVSFCLFRRFSFGFHFQKNFVCSIVSVICFSLIPLFIKNQMIMIDPNMYIIIGFLLIIISFVKVPAVSRPVSNPIFKRSICLVIIFFSYFILGYGINFDYSIYICTGVLISNILLLPIIGGTNQ